MTKLESIPRLNESEDDDLNILWEDLSCNGSVRSLVSFLFHAATSGVEGDDGKFLTENQ